MEFSSVAVDPDGLVAVEVGPGCSRRDLPAPAGVRAWVVKPFKPDQMLTAVSKLILP